MQVPSAIRELSEDHPLLLIFLRHFGCTFCREALADVAEIRGSLEALGAHVAFVHMQPPEVADAWFDRYHLRDVPRFSDPDRALYRAFGLGAGSLVELGHPRVWGRWFRAAAERGAGYQGADWRQLPGVFVVHNGDILATVRQRDAATRPDYLGLVRRALAGSGTKEISTKKQELRT
jgi:hypothetical protein